MRPGEPRNLKIKTDVETLVKPAHALAGTIMSGAEMIMQVLADEGVRTIFGYSGGAILPTYDAVFRYNATHAEDGREPIPLIVPANEQGAGFMAAGYSRASGEVGVAIVTSGPCAATEKNSRRTRRSARDSVCLGFAKQLLLHDDGAHLGDLADLRR